MRFSERAATILRDQSTKLAELADKLEELGAAKTDSTDEVVIASLGIHIGRTADSISGIQGCVALVGISHLPTNSSPNDGKDVHSPS
jgi:hypothetical protein